jgi:ribosomal subunit interface protein
MEIQIQTSHVHPSEKLIRFVEERVQKLEKLYSGAIKATIFLKTENAHKHKNKTVEILIHGSGKDLFASSKSNKFEMSVAATVAALRRQIQKVKS